MMIIMLEVSVTNAAARLRVRDKSYRLRLITTQRSLASSGLSGIL